MNNGQETKNDADHEASASSLESVWAAWTKWLKRAGLAATLSGTVLALLYFFKIGHMPLDSLSSLAGLSTAIAFVSIGGLGVLTTLWGIPGFFMHFGFLEFPEEVRHIFMRRGKLEAAQPTSPAKVLPSFLRALAWSVGTLGLPWLALLTAVAPDQYAGCDGAWVLPTVCGLLALLITSSLILGVDPRKGLKAQGQIIKTAWPAQHKLLLPTVGYVLVSVLALTAFIPVAGFHAASGTVSFHAEVLVCIVTAVALNAMAIGMGFLARNATPQRRAGVLVLYVMLVSLTIALMLSLFSAWSAAHEWVMVRANVRIPKARLILDKAACDVLPASLLQAVPKRSSADAGACALEDALIVSAVGTRWVVAMPKTNCVRYIIKSEHVTLMETAEPRRPSATTVCPRPAPIHAAPAAPPPRTCPF